MGLLSMKVKAQKGFTLVEFMTIITIFGIIITIAVTTWVRSRETARARGCQENLHKISEAKELYALENKRATGDIIDMTDLYAGDGSGFLKSEPKCPAGGIYYVNPIGEDATCDYVTPLSIVDKHSL